MAALPSEDLLALDEALTKLATDRPRQAELVQLRFFAGLPIDEAADLVGISRARRCGYWVYARAWFHEEITGGDQPHPA